jgi:hypothetical protein
MNLYWQSLQPDSVVRKLLKLYNVDVETSASLRTLEESHPDLHLICNSCDSAILLTPSSVVGHSHRHDSMEIDLIKLSPEVQKALPTSLPGIAHALRYSHTVASVQNIRDMKIYGCRHCLQVRCEEVNGWIVKPDISVWQKTAMSWNGLTSHLIAKYVPFFFLSVVAST